MSTSSSSSAESESESTTARSTARRRIGRRRTASSAEESDVSANDSFGEGVESSSEDSTERPPRRRTVRRRAPRRNSDEASSDNFGDGVHADGELDNTASVMEEARLSRFEDDDSSTAGSPRAAQSSEGQGSGRRNSNDDDRPRRRRRRRRRGGGGGGGGAKPSEGRGGENTGTPSGGRGGRGRHSDRNSSRDRRDRDRDRDRGRGRSSAPSQRRGRQVQPGGEAVEGTFEGVLELHPKGYGFLRDPKKNYAAEDANPFVSSSVVEKFRLREGVLIRGQVGPGTRNQGPRLLDVELIDGFTPEEYEGIKHFDELTAINPFEQIKLEVGAKPVTMRVMDLLCPIGKGQRALLVAPPRTGKTMLLQDIANSVSINHPEIHLMVLLIDERPEEVTEMSRNVNGEVIASSLDNDVESHVRIAQLIIERGKRLAEEGQDVFILLDSITRLARAFNKWVNPSGRTGRGGLDIRALDVPKKLFGTARRFD
ncbi:MAG: transcription termination factor Rho, partial [Planctomycetaceae bacterium]|nr:transcription termination factor Rho [Planctomycetaceae bacterium]